MTKARKKFRITTATTTTVTSKTCYVHQVVVACPNAGTAFTLKIQDKAGTPFALIPAYTLSVTTGTPTKNFFDEPIQMDGGIDIVTGGTPGEVLVWLIMGRGEV